MSLRRLLLAVARTADLSPASRRRWRPPRPRVVDGAPALIYVGGDLAGGDGTVAAAIGSGRRAALRHPRRAHGITGADGAGRSPPSGRTTRRSRAPRSSILTRSHGPTGAGLAPAPRPRRRELRARCAGASRPAGRRRRPAGGGARAASPAAPARPATTASSTAPRAWSGTPRRADREARLRLLQGLRPVRRRSARAASSSCEADLREVARCHEHSSPGTRPPATRWPPPARPTATPAAAAAACYPITPQTEIIENLTAYPLQPRAASSPVESEHSAMARLHRRVARRRPLLHGELVQRAALHDRERLRGRATTACRS